MILKLFGYLALALTILPSVLFFFGSIEASAMRATMLVGMVLWFGTAPFAFTTSDDQS